jgi:hypothetical protein
MAGFDSRKRKNFSVIHRVQRGSGGPYCLQPIGTRGDFSGGKEAGA